MTTETPRPTIAEAVAAVPSFPSDVVTPLDGYVYTEHLVTTLNPEDTAYKVGAEYCGGTIVAARVAETNPFVLSGFERNEDTLCIQFLLEVAEAQQAINDAIDAAEHAVTDAMVAELQAFEVAKAALITTLGEEEGMATLARALTANPQTDSSGILALIPGSNGAVAFIDTTGESS